MRIMVVSVNAWNDTNSFGNTVSNFFEDWEDTEILSVYFRGALPQNNVCKKYFRINEKMMIKSLIFSKNVGSYFEYDDIIRDEEKKSSAAKEDKIIALLHKYNFSYIYKVIDLLWSLKSWQNKKFKKCIEEFAPDIVFSFVRPNAQEYYTVEYIKKYTNAKIVVFATDDFYTGYKNMHTLYGKKMANRLRNFVAMADKVYGISPQICEYYQKEFGKEISLLQKGCTYFCDVKLSVSNPIKIIYAGNFHYGRLNMLCKISKIVESFRDLPISMSFDIYSGDYLINEDREKLENSSTHFKGCLNYSELEKILSQSDIVLHAESFEPQEIEKVKMSFSTKITDCLKSGCVMLVVGPEEISSVQCAKKIPGTIVIDDISKIESGLKQIIDNYDRLTDMARKTQEYAKRHYQIDVIRQKLKEDLQMLMEI